MKKYKLLDHWTVYSNLCDLLHSYEYYGMVYEDLYEVHDFVEYFSNIEGVCSTTIEAAKKFQFAWYNIIRSKSYSSDRAFIYLDTDFQSILDNELLSFLKLLNDDLKAIEFPNIETLTIENRIFPDNETILKQASILYDLLYKHKILRK